MNYIVFPTEARRRPSGVEGPCAFNPAAGVVQSLYASTQLSKLCKWEVYEAVQNTVHTNVYMEMSVQERFVMILPQIKQAAYSTITAAPSTRSAFTAIKASLA
jgi:hypothetical protein